jgi:imidazolonepropionase-like amidohydrolase
MAEKNVILCPTLTIFQHVKWVIPYEGFIESFKTALRANVKIAMGTDAKCFGARWSSHEMELMVKAGMTPMQSIVSSTKIASRACGLGEKLGTLEKGKIADFVALDGDPLRDISILQKKERIRMIVKAGQIIKNS